MRAIRDFCGSKSVSFAYPPVLAQPRSYVFVTYSYHNEARGHSFEVIFLGGVVCTSFAVMLDRSGWPNLGKLPFFIYFL